MVNISVVVIAKNEESRIKDCLESVKWADEIIVLDDMSTDKTVEIAQSYGARVEKRKMENEGRHRNYGYSIAKNNWVLSLDCDERVSLELQREIQEKVGHDEECSIYSIKMKNYIGNIWINTAGYYPSQRAKLFRRDRLKYEESKVHPRLLFNGEGSCKNINLDEHIIHYSFKNFADFIRKLNRETDYEVEKWISDNRKMTFLKAFRKACSRFLKGYISKKGFQSGFIGFIFSFFHALYQIVAYAKYWEIKHNNS